MFAKTNGSTAARTYVHALARPMLLAGSLAVLSVIALTMLPGPARAAVRHPDPLDPALAERFRLKTAAGYAALEADSAETALGRFQELTQMIPDSPLAFYHLACANGRAARPDEARAALEKAVELGFADTAQVGSDPDLEMLRTRADWPALQEGMIANLAEGRVLLAERLAQPLPNEEPPFTSLDSLKAYYGSEQRRVMSAGRVYAEPAFSAMQLDVLKRKLAALERLLLERADAAEAYPVRLEIFGTQSHFAELDSRPWTLGRERVVASAEEMLRLYPDSSGAAWAALWKARAAWYGRLTGEVADMPAEAWEQAVGELRAVAQGYPGTPAGCQALAEALEITAEGTQRDVERLRPLLTELEAGCTQDRATLDRFVYTLNEYRLLVHGAPDFTATDIDGREWHLADLRGRPVLLDFWATWCGPCVAEMPTMLRIRERYPESELVILGISLDQTQRLSVEAFRQWLAKKGMSWPQIYAGGGWKTELAQLYHVMSIPCPVLIAADGTVLAAGDGARADKLEKLLAKTLGH
jgi:thiol-disulfide isomerase/thioredoxin